MLKTSRRSIEAGIVTGVLAAMVLSQAALGQLAKVHVHDNPIKGTRTNLFASWDGDDRMDGLAVELPTGWTVESVAVLRHGYQQVNAQIYPLDGRRFRVVLDEPLEDPADIILGLVVGEGYAAERLEVVPLIRSGSALRERSGLAISQTVRARDEVIDYSNKALSFAGDVAEPLTFRRRALPEFHTKADFSVSFWMKTATLGEVVLSTWNGDDRAPYPVEIIVDQGGRLRSFRGRPGEHQSVGSKIPVADGQWHQIELINEAGQGWMYLLVDGSRVDSLYSPVAPAISAQLPLVLGGRADGRNPYFDGLQPFTGHVDDIEISAVGSSGDRLSLAFGFEDPIPGDVLQNPMRGLRRVDSDRLAGSDVHDLRVDYVDEGIVLSWRSSASDVQRFVVERSADGRSFEEFERLAPTEDGIYRVQDGPSSRVVYYRVRQIFEGGMERASGTVKVGIGEEQPSSAVVIGNYPNPFNASTTITYEVRETTEIQLAIWDLSGQPIHTLVDRTQNAGVYQARFDADGLPSGTYFVRLRTPGGVESHKMILAK